MRKDPLPVILACFLLSFTWFGLNYLADQKAFWFDEILTLRVSEAALGPDLWQAMTAGFEFNPPLAYLTLKASESVYGRAELTSRFPFIFAAVLSLFLIFLIQVRKEDPWAGIWAILFIFCTEAFSFFYEARGYIFVICSALIAWFCYECLDKFGKWRHLRLFGIFAAMALALLSHMWAILLPAAFGAAILYQCWRTKQLDLKPLIAIALACPIALHYLPLVAATKAVRFNNEVYNASITLSTQIIVFHLPIFCFLLILVVLILKPFFKSSSDATAEFAPDFQTLFSIGLISMPLVIYSITRITEAPYMRRYGLLFTLGIAILLARPFSSQFVRAHIVVKSAALALALLMVFERYGHDLANLDKPSAHQFEASSLGPLRDSAEPVYFASGLDYLPADYYASPALSRRFFFIADRARAIQFTGSDGVDSALLFGQSRLRLHNQLATWKDLTDLKSNFWVVDSNSTLNWLRPALIAAGYKIKPLAAPNQSILYVSKSE